MKYDQTRKIKEWESSWTNCDSPESLIVWILGSEPPVCEFISHVQEYILPELTSNRHLLSQLDLLVCGRPRRFRLTESISPQLERHDSVKTY